MRPSRRVILLTVVAVACGALLVGVALIGIQRPERKVIELSDRIFPASQALEEAAEAHAESNQLFLAALSGPPDQRSALVSQSQDAGNRANTAWREYRNQAFGSPAEQRLQRRYLDAIAESTAAGATVFGLIDSPDRDAFAAALAAEQQAASGMTDTIHSILQRFYDSRRAVDLRDAKSSLASVQSWILIAFGFVLALGLTVAFVMLRGAFREERLYRAREEERQYEQSRADLENQLQRGLEMEPTEEATYSVIAEALGRARPDEPVEVLIADSSRAHFRQVLSTDPAGLPACAVSSPGDCPAASSGQTRVFISSTRLDACPYLRSREGEPISAACVPISIAGTNSGMIHTTGPDQHSPEAKDISKLELVARKAGDRIGFLRVMARTETQARVDGLTGLFNRRSLEDQASEIFKRGDGFVVAFADLDHFKDLNDKYGHEIGDRALRLFARVLRDSVRPADIPARFGGEEFVVLLPNCTISDARTVANRLREGLATAIAGATIPRFTVSVGLAEWEPPELFDETVARADAALLAAKRAGRDRVLAAGEIAPSDEPTSGVGGNGAGAQAPTPAAGSEGAVGAETASEPAAPSTGDPGVASGT